MLFFLAGLEFYLWSPCNNHYHQLARQTKEEKKSKELIMLESMSLDLNQINEKLKSIGIEGLSPLEIRIKMDERLSNLNIERPIEPTIEPDDGDNG